MELFERADRIALTRLVRVELGKWSMAVCHSCEGAMRHPEPDVQTGPLMLSTPIRQRYKWTQLTRRMVTVAIWSEIM